MTLVDSNVWLALALSKHEAHRVARDWLATLSGQQALFCRFTQMSFLRLLTTRAVLAPYRIPPLTNAKAWSVYSDLSQDERVGWADEPVGIDTSWQRLSAQTQASPKLWVDAYLAAFAMAANHQLVTIDKAFKQFKGLDLLLLPSKT